MDPVLSDAEERLVELRRHAAEEDAHLRALYEAVAESEARLIALHDVERIGSR